MLGPEPNALFRRRTDDFIATRIGKRPLDVGGDRIARAAHAALRILHELRGLSGQELRVATRRGEGQVLEVYPGATLSVRGLPSSGYKGAGGQALREQLLEGLDLDLAPGIREAALESDHVLDAILCCVSARDYVLGKTLDPEDASAARTEGWIWVRDPGSFGA